jgi:hypothetical protein
VRRVPLIEIFRRFAKGGFGRPSFLLACTLAALEACATTGKPSPAAAPVHDGSSLERAVPILESTEAAGVAAERAWLAEHYPGARKLLGGLQADQGRHYDVLKLRLPDGTEKTLYFDISAYFGF